MISRPVDRTTEDYLQLALTGQRRDALSHVRRLEGEGADAASLLHFVGNAQREVGLRWQRNECSVADEHAVTAINDAVISTIMDSTSLESQAGRVALVCADGEWHVMPARLLAHELELAGWATWFAGGSVPPEHLHATLPDLGVQAVALSCTLSLHLPGAARSVAAIHAAGLPVLVGGGGFDGGGVRARAIGADAMATSAAEAVDVLTAWNSDPPSTLASSEPADADAAAALLREEAYLVGEAYEALAARFEDMVRYDERERRRTREDLSYHVRYLAAAMLTGDATVYVDMVTWLAAVLDARGVPSRALQLTLEVLTEVAGIHRHEAAMGILRGASSTVQA
ncbi:MAG: cobalamin-dependent protein [Nitriliruptorales bacterium]|nr:cobalamin-dependent protein [Nitriliruptorales bacterium]